VAATAGDRTPNVLLIVSDQERQRDWLPAGFDLPARQRLIDGGLEFTRYYTHTSPCSPSRATIFTGRYVPQHGVNENVIHPVHTELDPAITTLGHTFRSLGYRTSYLGKWHLSHDPQPDMEAYGFSDWTGNDRAYMGWAGTGVEYDPPIADQAVDWLRANAQSTEPWFLTVALVNPHDVMWFPIDQPGYQATHPDEVAFTRELLSGVRWKDGEVLPAFAGDYPELFDRLPENFDDALHTKPEVHRQWFHEQQHSLYGYLDPAVEQPWLRQLDYYAELHRRGDENLAKVLDALDEAGGWDDTIIAFTSDHGDMCGSHGLRSKGPFVYEEIMRIPLYLRVPGRTRPGSRTDALASHVDLASTLPLLAGAPEVPDGYSGVDLQPLFDDQAATVRDHVLFMQDSAWYARCIPTRYAMRGLFDGRFKYTRYYGVGGSTTPWGTRSREPKLYDVDARFEDHDHEWYDLQEDPHELVNLAHDRGRQAELREWFERLRAAEVALEPAG
jgi:arylsulfatase A-like enzyme